MSERSQYAPTTADTEALNHGLVRKEVGNYGAGEIKPAAPGVAGK